MMWSDGEGTISGFLDADTDALYDLLAGAGPAGPRHIQIMPKGMRWPWYPVIEGEAFFDPAVPLENLVSGSLSYDLPFRSVGSLTYSRVGWRVWAAGRREWFLSRVAALRDWYINRVEVAASAESRAPRGFGWLLVYAAVLVLGLQLWVWWMK